MIKGLVRRVFAFFRTVVTMPVFFFKDRPTPPDAVARKVDVDELRRNVGVLGFWLPLLLPLSLAVINLLHMLAGYEMPYRTLFLGSMSAYYYTFANVVFTGGLLVIGIFVLSYRGYDDNDERAGNFACLMAWMVAFFPMGEPARLSDPLMVDQVAVFNWSALTNSIQILHYVGAVGLFFTLSWFCLKSFTKAKIVDDEPQISERKAERIEIYKWCGHLILVMIALIAFTDGGAGIAMTFGWEAPAAVVFYYKTLYWFEMVMVMAFGISWFVKGKGKFLFFDPTEQGPGMRWVMPVSRYRWLILAALAVGVAGYLVFAAWYMPDYYLHHPAYLSRNLS